jgi:hypothetical protein
VVPEDVVLRTRWFSALLRESPTCVVPAFTRRRKMFKGLRELVWPPDPAKRPEGSVNPEEEAGAFYFH